MSRANQIHIKMNVYSENRVGIYGVTELNIDRLSTVRLEMKRCFSNC